MGSSKKIQIKFPVDLNKADIYNDDIDVYIIIDFEKVYVATFFTINNINSILSAKSDGVNYFISRDFVVVNDLKLETIINVIQQLVNNGELEGFFKMIGGVEEIFGVPPNLDNLLQVNLLIE